VTIFDAMKKYGSMKLVKKDKPFFPV